MARDFSSRQGLKNVGILYVFLVFQTAGLAEKIRRPRPGIYSEVPLIEGDRLGIEKHVDARPERCKGRIGAPAGIVQRGLCGALCL